MKKVFIFLLTVGALIAAPNNMIDSYGVGCAYAPLGADIQGDLNKAEVECRTCIKNVPTSISGIDQTDENVKMMVSKCVAEYQTEYNKRKKNNQ